MRSLPTLLISLLFCLLATACGPGAAPTPTLPPIAARSPTATVAGEVSTPAAPLTVTDALQREVVFEHPPDRIVIAGRASPLLADAIFLFPAAQDRIVAVEARAQRIAGFLTLVDPDFEQKTILERDASAEQILPFEPDLVIMKSFMAESLGDPLIELGIPVVYLDLETPNQYARDLRTLGQVFGNSERAEQLVDYIGDRTEQVQRLTTAAAGDTLPRILIMQYGLEGGEVSVQVPSVSWLQTQMAEMVTAEPVWRQAAVGEGWTLVGFEQIAAWNPEQIYVVDYFGDSGEAAASLAGDPNWAALGAVQQGQIHGFPADHLSWDQPDPRWILGLQWLATKVHPSVGEEIDLDAELVAFYFQLYGLQESTVQKEIIPLLSGDLN